MATLDEQSGTAADLTAARVAPAGPADGDNIVIVPDEPRPPRRRALVLAIVAIVAALVVIVGVVLATRDDTTKPVATATTPIVTVPKPLVGQKTSKPPVAKKSTPASLPPHVAPPLKPVIGKPVTHGTAAVHPPPARVAPPVSTEPLKTYPPSVLQWTAPESIQIKQGTTALLLVQATNPTNGTVTLPHPLSCTPRIDHSEVCAEVAQIVAARGSAGARYTIDATKVKPGSYTLSLEGLHTIRVLVTP